MTRRPRCVHADHAELWTLPFRFKLLAEGPLKAAIGIQRACEYVEQRNVVIAGHGDERRRCKTRYELFRCCKLRTSRALCNVAGEHHDLGLLLLPELQQRLDHSGPLRAEM